MQGSPSYGSMTGPSTDAAAAVLHKQLQQHQYHHQPHSHHQENNNSDVFMAIAATVPTVAHVFANSNTSNLSPSPLHAVTSPTPLTSIDIAASMFSAVTPSSPKSFASSTSLSVQLDMLPTSKTPNGAVSLTTARSPLTGSPHVSDAATTSASTAETIPGKRGHKSHVPSACINCKKAHLACNVSRPCKRCVTLGKIDTCQDTKHKKRGRPRLRGKQTGNKPQAGGYEIMCGTIQTPPSSMSLPSARPVVPHPPTNNRYRSLIAAPTQSSSTIGFIHESCSSFQEHTPPSSATPGASVSEYHLQHQQQHDRPSSTLPPQSHTSFNSTISTPHNANSIFLNTVPFSFEEVSFPESTNTIQQQYITQPYLTALPLDAPYQQQQQQSYTSQLHPTMQLYQQQQVQDHGTESASLQMKQVSTNGQQHPAPIALTPSPAPQLPPSPAPALQRNHHHHHHHQPPYHPQTQMHTHHHPTPQSPPPPPPVQRRQPSIATSVEQQHHVHVQSGYGKGREGEDGHRGKPMATIIMSMEVCCARVSPEVTEMWGYYPQEFAHRSFYDFISSKDTDRLARLHRLLLDNLVEVGQTADPHYSPPDTERTTSDLFHNGSIEELMLVAPGSSSFSDTLHVKKRSGDVELYEMIVCMGGAFGADLSNPASLSKVYIIGQLKKHEYKVSSRKYSLVEHEHAMTPDIVAFWPLFQSQGIAGSQSPPPTRPTPPSPVMLHHHHQQQRTPPSSSVGALTHTPASSSTPPLFHPAYRQSNISGGGGQVFRTASSSAISGPAVRSSSTSTAPSFSMPARDTTWTMGYQELRSTPGMGSSSSSTLPSRFKLSSHNNGSKMEPAKVNVAPITTQTKYSTNVAANPRKFNSNTLPSMFRHNNAVSTTPGAVYAGGPSAAMAPPISESSNPYSTLTSYRLGNNTSGPTSVTHPTTQYFLQTSSSTLNAAASAAQSITRQKGLYMSAADVTEIDKAAGSTDSNRKVEMSIRSLLC